LRLCLWVLVCITRCYWHAPYAVLLVCPVCGLFYGCCVCSSSMRNLPTGTGQLPCTLTRPVVGCEVCFDSALQSAAAGSTGGNAACTTLPRWPTKFGLYFIWDVCHTVLATLSRCPATTFCSVQAACLICRQAQHSYHARLRVQGCVRGLAVKLLGFRLLLLLLLLAGSTGGSAACTTFPRWST
jgi:hypothetical protein